MLFPVLLLLAAQVDVNPLRETASAPHQTDDPAIWVNPKVPSESLILGTVKMAAPDGAIVVYRLDGSVLMSIPGVDRPNNIDVAYGLKLGGRKIDIAIATERNQNRLRVFEVLPGKGIRDLATIPVFAQPMGIAIYKTGKGRGYIIATDQQTPVSEYYVYAREGGPNGPHGHAKALGSFRVGRKLQLRHRRQQ